MKDYLIYKRGKTWFEAVNLESDKMPLILETVENALKGDENV